MYVESIYKLAQRHREEGKILIIGLGVAGSYLACLLALTNMEVEACDAKNVPWQHIVCGEMVPDPELLRGKIPSKLFTYIAMTHEEIIRRTHILRTYDYLRIIVLDHEFYVPFKAHLIDKSKLIQELLAEAEQSVEMKFGTSVIKCKYENGKIVVKLLESGKPIEKVYDIVIGADSFPSVCYTEEVWTWLNSVKYLTVTCVAYRASVKGIDLDFPTIIIDPRIAPGGYAWIFPRTGDEANVGLGVLTELVYNLQTFMESFNKKFEIRPLSKPASKTLPMDGMIYRVGYRNLLLLGDAGGFVVPTNGAGINPAMVSSLLAYENKLVPDLYNKAAWRVFGKYSHKLAQLRQCIDPVLRNYEKLERAVKLVFSRKITGRLVLNMLTSLLMGYFRIFDRMMYSSLRIVSKALAL